MVNTFFGPDQYHDSIDKTDKPHVFCETGRYQYAMERVTNVFDAPETMVLKRRSR